MLRADDIMKIKTYFYINILTLLYKATDILNITYQRGHQNISDVIKNVDLHRVDLVFTLHDWHLALLSR